MGLKLTTVIFLAVFALPFCHCTTRQSYSRYYRSGGTQSSSSGTGQRQSDYDDLSQDSEIGDYDEADALKINQPLDSSSSEHYHQGYANRGTSGSGTHRTWSSTREFDCGGGTGKVGGCGNLGNIAGGGGSATGKQESGWSSSWSQQSRSSQSALPATGDAELESVLNTLRNSGNLNQTRTITGASTGGQPGATYYYQRRVYNWSSVATRAPTVICRSSACNQTITRTSSGRNRQYSQRPSDSTSAPTTESSSVIQQQQLIIQRQQEEQLRQQQLEEQQIRQRHLEEQQRQREFEQQRQPEPTRPEPTKPQPTREYTNQHRYQSNRHEQQTQYRPQQPTYAARAERPERPTHRQDNSRLEVTTTNGNCRGQLLTTVHGKEYYAFFGIPFAKPPVGDLRFKRPEPIGNWDETIIANTLPSACYQINATLFPGNPGEEQWNAAHVSEDCLYLNIWIPASIFRNKETDLTSVIFWIYGGGWYSGSASLDIYDGAVLATEKEIIVVSCQYRVGPFGFLYLDAPDAPGNIGLLDQALALKWVRNNIRYFGGDKDSVTLMGESAGAASVTHHLASPISRSLFSRAIIMSGVSTAPYAMGSQDDVEKSSLLLAKEVGCETNRAKSEIINCLRRVDAHTLTLAQFKQFKEMLNFPFQPTVDGHFIPSCAENLLNSYNAKRTEVLIGSTKDEGSYFLMYMYKQYFANRRNPDISFEQFLEIMGNTFGQRRSSVEADTIIDYYTNWKNPEDGQENMRRVMDAVGDSYFICPTRNFADTWSGRGLSVYQYMFTQRTSSNPWPEWMGVMHSDEIEYVFGVPLKDPERFTAQERQLSLHMMDLFVKFAKTGVPSSRWERYTEQKPTCLDLNATRISDETSGFNLGPRGDACTFWNKILPRIQGNVIPSSPGAENDAENVVNVESYVRELCQVSEGKSNPLTGSRRTPNYGGSKNICTTRRGDRSRDNQYVCQC